MPSFTIFIKFLILIIFMLIIMHEIVMGFNDVPCAAKEIYNRSVICVCNATYCDTIIREEPDSGFFMSYVSSEAGLRFNKESGYLKSYSDGYDSSTVLVFDPTITYQTIQGFGGAITDSVGINWNNLKDPRLKQHLIDSYYGATGLEYNMMRVPMGACDFSLRNYTYNDLPEGDKELTNFTLAPEDYQYKLPFIKACFQASRVPVNIISSLWSAPTWMKTNHDFAGVSYIKEEFFKTLAIYFKKFVQEYNKEGVPIWGMTVTNEPTFSILYLNNNDDLGWTVPGMAEWIVNYWEPMMREYDPSIKLIGVDDQRYTLPVLFKLMVARRPEVAKALDGIAVHFYFDDVTPPEIITRTMANYPDLFVISTEASVGVKLEHPVDLGSWERAEKYARDIIEDLNFNIIGWIDWNLCLNETGGPHWVETGLDAAVIVKADEGVFYKQPMFYIMGHFSKFIPRGSLRIKSEEENSCSVTIQHVAFLTPHNTIVIVLFNDKNFERYVILKINGKQAEVILQPKSITTVEFHNE